MRNIKSFLSLIFFICLFTQISAQQRIFRFANTGTDASIRQTLTDSSGNTYTVGNYYDFFQFQDLERISTANMEESSGDIFLLKTNSAGKTTYLNAIQGVDEPFDSYEYKTAINQKGELAAFFTFQGKRSVSFNGRIIELNDSLTTSFVVKYTKSGFLSWIRPFNVGTKYNTVTPKDITLDEEGNVYLAGEFYGKTADFGDGVVLVADSMESNMFVTKITANKNIAWAYTPQIADIDTSGGIFASHIELGPDGRVYVLGKNYGMRRFLIGPSSIQNKGIDNAFIACFENNGDPLWAEQAESDMYSVPEDISINNIGDIAFTCFFMGNEFRIQDQFINGNSTVYNAAVSHLTAQGEIQHIQYIGSQLNWVSSYEQEAFTYFTDSAHVVMAIKLDNSSITGLAFLKLLMDGTARYITMGSSADDVYLENAVVDKNETIHFLGHTYNNAPFTIGDATKNNDPGFPQRKTSFFGKINSMGEVEFLYNKTNTDTTNVTLSGLGTDKYGNIFLSGQYTQERSTLDDFPLGERFPTGVFIAKYAAVASASGKVVNMFGDPIPEGQVKLIGYTYRQKSPIADSSFIEPDGSFNFENVPLGKYILVASTEYQDDFKYLQTYFISEGHWTDAEHLVVSESTTISNIILIMTHEEPLDGAGTLTGVVNEVEENDIFKSTQQKPRSKGKASLAKSKKKSDYDIIAVTDLDEDGNFYFNGVNEGSYTVIIDIPGVPHEGYHQVFVEGGSYISNINYLVGEETITMDSDPQVSIIGELAPVKNFTLYPNPSRGNIFIELEENNHSSILTIQNIDGKLILMQQVESGLNTIQGLAPGIYIATVKSVEFTETTKFIITE